MLLHIVVGTILATAGVFIYLICELYGLALFICFLLGAFPFVLVGPLAEAITKRAEFKKTRPNIWFAVDMPREKQKYGPLRVKRLFKEHERDT